MGQPLKMAPYMQEDFRAIYDNPVPTRRAIITRARKNAKTVEAALIVLLHLCGPEARPNSQLYSAAQSRDQASLLFGLAGKIIRLSPNLAAVVSIRETAKVLHCQELGTIYRALSAEATTAFGLSPTVIVHDELGQVRGPRSPLYEALETATGAQAEPLSIIISTQAPTDSDLLSVLIDDAKAAHDPRVVLRMDTAPTDLDPFSVEAIRIANPAFDYFLNQSEVLAMADDARRMPSREAEFCNLILNQRVEASAPFISRQLWKTCGTKPETIQGCPVYGGLDLSEVADLTALVLMGKVEGIWQIHPTFWLPKDGLADKAREDRVPYDLWVKNNQLMTVPGRSVDYHFVAQQLKIMFELYDIRKIGFDRYNFKHLKPWLLTVGMDEALIDRTFVEINQQFPSMSPILRDLESEVLNGRLAHGNHPVLSMCAANAVVQSDPQGNRKLAKNKSSGRIDGMVALAMAFGAVASYQEQPAADYQMLFVA